MLFAENRFKRTGLLVYACTGFLFAAQSCVFPHMSRYYDLDLHLNDWQIGLLMSLTSLGAATSQPFWGMMADRVIGRTPCLRLALVNNVIFLLLFAFAYQLGGFFLLAPSAILFYGSYNATIPINSSIILSYLGREKRHLFGRIRFVGSLFFTLTMFLICPVMVSLSRGAGFYGRTFVFFSACIFYLITLLCTFWDEEHFEKHNKPQMRNFLDLIRNRNLLIFYLSIFFSSISASAGLQYIGPYMGHRGLSERFFSIFWLVGVSMEILLTYNMHHLIRSLGLKFLVVSGFASEFIRWCGISFSHAPGLILVCNLLHGFAVMGTYFASAMYLDHECKENVRSTAQALLYFFSVFGQVTGYILGSMLVNHYSGFMPRAEAIQSCFLWFSLFALTATLFAASFLQPRGKMTVKPYVSMC